MGFCPLTKDECREDCDWLDVKYEMDDDGVARSTCCSVVGIYAVLLAALTDVEFIDGGDR